MWWETHHEECHEAYTPMQSHWRLVIACGLAAAGIAAAWFSLRTSGRVHSRGLQRYQVEASERLKSARIEVRAVSESEVDSDGNREKVLKAIGASSSEILKEPRAKALAEAFMERLGAVVARDYSRFSRREALEGYVMWKTAESSWAEFREPGWITEAAAWDRVVLDFDSVQVFAADNADKMQLSRSERMTLGEEEGVRGVADVTLDRWLPEFQGVRRAAAPSAIVRVRASYVDLKTGRRVGGFVGYQFAWNERSEVWVLTNSVVLSEPGTKFISLPTE